MMKKICSAASILVVLAAMILGAYTENRADSSALNFPDTEWGMTWEEVMSAGGIAEENVVNNAEGQFSSAYIIEDYEVFGEKSSRVCVDMNDLGGGTKKLTAIMVYYPDDADMDHVREEMTKAYGSPIPELTDYELFNPFVGANEAHSLYAKQYTESEQMKIWAGSPLGEVIPKEQDQEYMKAWQEKIYPQENSVAFQPGLNDGQWDEFKENARMVSVLWMNEADEYQDGNRVYFNAYNDQAFDEVTRRTFEQEKK